MLPLNLSLNARGTKRNIIMWFISYTYKNYWQAIGLQKLYMNIAMTHMF